MEKKYNLEKTMWSENDFNEMNWHDNKIHAMSFQDEFKFLLDIDYIFKWQLKSNKKKYLFWISPCTMIFENVYDIVFDLEVSVPHQVIIDNITMTNPRKPKNVIYLEKQIEYDWLIETINGDISFKSVGFDQFVKKTPISTNKNSTSIAGAEYHLTQFSKAKNQSILISL